MDMSIASMRLLLAILFCGQLSFGMEHQIIPINSQEQLFTCFLLLVQDLQNKIFDCSDNKTNMQHVNKEWNKQKSIQADDIFTYVHLAEKEMTCILLNAAYLGNYIGVENILKSTDILEKTKNRLPFYQMGNCIEGNKGAVLDLRGIVKNLNDEKMWKILDIYSIPAFTPNQTICLSTPLNMAILAGDSNSVQNIFTIDRIAEKNIKFSINIATDFDRVQCFKVLCNAQKTYPCIKDFINKSLLERACVQKSKNVLKELLVLRQNDAEIAKTFDLNTVTTYCLKDYSLLQQTFLDKILAHAEKHPEFNEIAVILKDNGAITAEEKIKSRPRNEQAQSWWNSLSLFKKKSYLWFDSYSYYRSFVL